MGEYEAHAKRMRQTICDAAIILMAEKPLSKITIQDILNTAQIQRATFYRYFRDKYEVAESISETVAVQISDMFFSEFYSGNGYDYEVQVTFDLKYHKVLREMMNLKIESVDLPTSLIRVFSRTYAEAFPDAGAFEIYLASQNFLAFVRWHADRNSTLQEIRASVRAEDQTKWFARFNNVQVKVMSDFISHNRE